MTIPELTEQILDDLVKVSASRHNTLGVPGFRTEMRHLRISAAQIRMVEKKWITILYDFTSDQWVELCIQLTQNGVFECQILAYEFLWKNKNALRSLSYEQILVLGATLDNWASTDAYSTMIAGWHWREGTLPDTQILEWLKSKNHWMRRVAVVCTIPLNLRSKGGTGDPKRTFMVCRKAVNDRDDMVVKALSWALRELSKTAKRAVEDFLMEYSEQLHPRVRREVSAKLETGRKNG
jgi:3-methyladenine DNA glycosylase AlkD